MSIKLRLILNTLLVIIAIGAIAGISRKSIFAIKTSVDQLTLNSTPQQVKTIQLQQAVEKLSAEFLRLGMARNGSEAGQVSDSVSARIEEIKQLDEQLKQFGGGVSGLDTASFERLHTTVAKAVREKQDAIRSFQSESDSINTALQGVGTSLEGIHVQTEALNASAFNVVRSAQQLNLRLNNTVKKALSMQYKLKEIDALLSEIDATRSKYRLSPFKDKMKAATDAIQNFPLESDDPTVFREAKATSADLNAQVIKDPGGLLALKAQALTTKDESAYSTLKKRLIGTLDDITGKLSQVVDPLELQMLKSRQAVERALDQQKQSGQIVAEGALIEIDAKELNAQVRLVMLSSSLAELEARKTALGVIRGRIGEEMRALEGALAAANGQGRTEQNVQAIAQAMAQTKGATDRIVAAKRNVLVSDALMQKTFANIRSIVSAQARNGDLQLKDATHKQDETVAQVNERVRSSLSLLFTLSMAVAVIMLALNLLMIVQITRPLNRLSRTVMAVATEGDFSKRVEMRSRDEVGRTVAAFNRLMETLHSAISRINLVMADVAQGDFSGRVEVELKGDLDTLKGSINRSVDSLQLAISDINVVMAGVSRGDFTHQIDTQLSGELEVLKSNINTSVDSVQRAIHAINIVMEGLSQGDFSHEVAIELEGDLGGLRDSINATVGKLKETTGALSLVMHGLARGDFQIRVNADVAGEFKNNIDLMIRTMQTMQAVIGDINGVMCKVAAGDLTLRVQAKAEGDLQQLAEGINTSLDSLQQTLQLVHRNSLSVSSASEETSATVGQVTEGVQTQSGAVRQLVDSIGRTTQVIVKVVETTQVARNCSRQSAELVNRGQEQMDAMLASVQAIAEHSSKIGSITDAITGIAEQTQLLSLNANIEAARAGEQGRGFAVVADEVRKLAEQASAQVEEIKALVSQATGSSEQGVAVAQAVGAEMDRIVRNVLDTDRYLQEISSSMEQQTSVVREMEESVSRLESIAIADSAAAQQMAASMSELSGLARQTQEQVAQFKVA